MVELLQFEFMRNALLAGLMVSCMCGIIGTLVVVNRIVFISGGISHAAYGGVGLSFFLGISPQVGVLGFSLLVSVIMAGVSLKVKHRADAVIGVLWAMGMALGVILLDLTPGYTVDLMSYLFGSILTVPTADLWVMLTLNAMVILVVSYFYHDLLALSYDEEFARVRGVKVRGLYFILMAMVAVTVVMIIQVVGLILIMALLTIAPFMAEKYTRSLTGMMICAIIFNILFTVTGLWLAYAFNVTSGAAIIMVGGVCFFISILINHLRKRRSEPLERQEFNGVTSCLHE